MTTTTQPTLSSECVTDGVRVKVVPSYLPTHSDPANGRYLFAYHVTIVNEGTRRARLRSRQWAIVDADGERHEVQGMGVVGHHPDLKPGERFEYSSFCPLNTSWGTMEGLYVMEREDGSAFDARIKRFYLVGPTG